ncbi:hypothetical protein A2U01_0039687, partial [Trifolium medium]|nr:hypothetical protein [Trifolium medium]
ASTPSADHDPSTKVKTTFPGAHTSEMINELLAGDLHILKDKDEIDGLEALLLFSLLLKSLECCLKRIPVRDVRVA